MISVRVLPEAQFEIEEAFLYYREISALLSDDLLQDYLATVALASAFPKIGPALDKDLRKMSLGRFPYNVIYHEEAGGLLGAVFAHQS